jgi:hypothetical protein
MTSSVEFNKKSRTIVCGHCGFVGDSLPRSDYDGGCHDPRPVTEVRDVCNIKNKDEHEMIYIHTHLDALNKATVSPDRREAVGPCKFGNDISPIHDDRTVQSVEGDTWIHTCPMCGDVMCDYVSLDSFFDHEYIPKKTKWGKQYKKKLHFTGFELKTKDDIDYLSYKKWKKNCWGIFWKMRKKVNLDKYDDGTKVPMYEAMKNDYVKMAYKIAKERLEAFDKVYAVANDRVNLRGEAYRLAAKDELDTPLGNAIAGIIKKYGYIRRDGKKDLKCRRSVLNMLERGHGFIVSESGPFVKDANTKWAYQPWMKARARIMNYRWTKKNDKGKIVDMDCREWFETFMVKFNEHPRWSMTRGKLVTEVDEGMLEPYVMDGHTLYRTFHDETKPYWTGTIYDPNEKDMIEVDCETLGAEIALGDHSFFGKAGDRSKAKYSAEEDEDWEIKAWNEYEDKLDDRKSYHHFEDTPDDMIAL